ncbi:MAG: hypothetical protein ACYCO3_10540, partial [Mycobacteriales bacterium]
WWRRWHDGSDDELDNAHLMRMAGRFARRVRAWGGQNTYLTRQNAPKGRSLQRSHTQSSRPSSPAR